MSCNSVRKDFSSYLEGDLTAVRRELVAAHLESCPGCARHLSELREVSAALSSMPRLVCQESLAAGMMDRVEVESRGPGLALLFRSALSARPLMVPSVLPAALVAVSMLSGIFMVSARDIAVAQARAPMPAIATAADDYIVSQAADAERSPDFFVDEQFIKMKGQEDLFMETFVTLDGQVWAKLIEGDSKTAAPIMREITRQRGVPARNEDGKPTTLRTFRLISSVDVRAPRT
jgi:Putative zinc-finger